MVQRIINKVMRTIALLIRAGFHRSTNAEITFGLAALRGRHQWCRHADPGLERHRRRDPTQPAVHQSLQSPRNRAGAAREGRAAVQSRPTAAELCGLRFALEPTAARTDDRPVNKALTPTQPAHFFLFSVTGFLFLNHTDPRH